MNVKYFIKIKQGNLLSEKYADFIVNPSNTVLMLGSGVSMAFAKHCGHELQIEMHNLLSEIHATGYTLKKGDVIPSKPSRATNFKHALHAAIMDYNPGVHFNDKNPELSDIRQSLVNIEKCIVEYSKLHNKNDITLVIPLMGCGHGGLDKCEVIELYLRFFNASKKSSSINCKVIIYGYSKEDSNLLTELLLEDV